MKYFIIFRVEGTHRSGENQEKIEVDYQTYIGLFEKLREKYPDRVQIGGKDGTDRRSNKKSIARYDRCDRANPITCDLSDMLKTLSKME